VTRLRRLPSGNSTARKTTTLATSLSGGQGISESNWGKALSKECKLPLLRQVEEADYRLILRTTHSIVNSGEIKILLPANSGLNASSSGR
jgi:hypothetical protein